MNKSLKSFYDTYQYPEIQKFLSLATKKAIQVRNIINIL